MLHYSITPPCPDLLLTGDIVTNKTTYREIAYLNRDNTLLGNALA